MSGNDPILMQLFSEIQDSIRQGATTAEAVTQLTARFDRLERRLFGDSGEVTKTADQVSEIKAKLTWAKGYIAGMIAAFSLAGSAATLLIQWALKKWGGH
jgi:5,10-methenyltetrahydromethanopterin hydrogenase